MHIQTNYKHLIDNIDKVIVIHARRTDYVKRSHYHGPLTQNYYTQAIAHMKTIVPDPIFLVTSDDASYWEQTAKSMPELQNYPIYFFQEDEITTMSCLQQFQHYIIANSTFSWWFAWLANAKVVIAPKQWFGPAGPRQWEDIYDPTWIRI
jgi:hypothetical protein